MAKITPHYMIYEFDGERFLNFFDSANDLFHEASYMYAFNDCECGEMEIKEIISDGRHCYYEGWKPDMEFVFHNEDGEIVWDNCYPEWDH